MYLGVFTTKPTYQVAIVVQDTDNNGNKIIREFPIFISVEDPAAVDAYVKKYFPNAIRHYIQQEVGK